MFIKNRNFEIQISICWKRSLTVLNYKQSPPEQWINIVISGYTETIIVIVTRKKVKEIYYFLMDCINTIQF